LFNFSKKIFAYCPKHAVEMLKKNDKLQ